MKREEAINLIDNLIGFIDDNQGNDYGEAFKMAIEALKNEPCEDCISRQEALDMCKQDGANDCISAYDIEYLPSVKPTRPKGEWIPIDERLPEDEGEYLVTVRIEDDDFTNYGEKEVFTLFFQKPNHIFHEPIWFSTDHAEIYYERWTVLAWMPLPEPYEPKEGDTE